MKLDKDKAALMAICQIMKEDTTLDSLAEWWQNDIYKESEKECYKELRLKKKGLTKELAAEEEKIKVSDDDSENEPKFYDKWENKDGGKNKGPDRCTLGHALQLC